jgi:ankyrin repeat protein/mono/diheme cytochrome c family protein
MKRIALWFLALSISLAAQAPQISLPPAATARVDYEKDVKPILAQNCYSCHGDAVQQSGLRLDLRQNALRGGDYGPVIVPGKSAESKLIKRVVDGDGAMQMPPSGPLSPEDIGILRAWIDQGVEFRTTIAEVPPKPTDPKIAELITAVRTQPAAAIATLIRRDRDSVTSRDQAGSTLLHHAAGFGSLETMTLLLDAGADVSAKNRRGSTPLHWAIHDEAKVRLLISRGAAVNARQVEGRTPAYLAASLGDGTAVLKLLLEQGADPRTATATGMTPLMAAAVRGDVATLRLIADKNVDINAKDGAGETALMFAATNGSPDAVGFLLDRGADARVKSKRNETPLGNAATAGVEATVRLLLDHGAEVNVRNIRGYSPLMLAAGSDAVPSGAVKLLLAKGADTTYTADYDESARDLASKRGDTAVVRLLGGLPSKTNHPAPMSVPVTSAEHRSISGAIETAMGLLEKQSYNFIRTAGCNSCHSQDLASAANGVARGRGLKVPGEIPQLPQSMMPSPERLMDLAVVSVPGTAWELVDFGMNNVPRSEYTDAAVRLIKAGQLPNGSWSSNESRRPPMNAGDFQAAAVCIYALKQYGQSGGAATDQAIAKAVSWLETARPKTTQDLAFQAVGLAWASSTGSETMKKATRALSTLQRADGGWSQFSGLESDAYATGQALYALSLSGSVPATDEVYRKGIEYLLRTQAVDGSWHVTSRSIWLQPYFESGFPYGQDQFISTAGTAWASMALAAAVQRHENTQR